MPQRRFLRARRPSVLSSNDSTTTSLRYFPTPPSLGDKLQRLTLEAPACARILELMVDEMLRRIDQPKILVFLILLN